MCMWVCSSVSAYAQVCEYMRAATVCREMETRVFVPPHIRACARVSLGHYVQQVGQVRPACQCVEHLWHPCHPRASQLCPQAGRLGRGTSSQGGPQAVFVHYRFRDRTVPAGGQTFSPYLL